MREITIRELITLSADYLGKQVEVAISPIYSTNNYSQFSAYETEEALILYDKNSKLQQELKIFKDLIVRILYFEGDNFFKTSISIFLNNESRIDFCVSEKEIHCVKCGKTINTNPIATIWSIDGRGNYGSHFDDEELHVKLCDDCLYYDIFGYVDGQFDNIEETNYYLQ